jgi:hypothetical protein
VLYPILSHGLVLVVLDDRDEFALDRCCCNFIAAAKLPGHFLSYLSSFYIIDGTER